MQKFETFSTTADVGIRIRSLNYKGLYESAVKGLNLLLFGEKTTGKNNNSISSYKYKYRGDSTENVLVNLLAEILFLLQCRGKKTVAVYFKLAKENEINAELMLSDTNQEPELDIKSVTYHNLKVIVKNNIKYTEIIFDI